MARCPCGPGAGLREAIPVPSPSGPLSSHRLRVPWSEVAPLLTAACGPRRLSYAGPSRRKPEVVTWTRAPSAASARPGPGSGSPVPPGWGHCWSPSSSSLPSRFPHGSPYRYRCGTALGTQPVNWGQPFWEVCCCHTAQPSLSQRPGPGARRTAGPLGQAEPQDRRLSMGRASGAQGGVCPPAPRPFSHPGPLLWRWVEPLLLLATHVTLCK